MIEMLEIEEKLTFKFEFQLHVYSFREFLFEFRA